MWVDISQGNSVLAKFTSLTIYLLLNMGLTFFNKAALGKTPFPYLLTTLHAGVAYIGCQILVFFGVFTPNRSLRSSSLAMAAFSVLYTLNIAISNVSLALVSIPFHQVIRATTPAWTVLIYRYYGQNYSYLTYASLIPVVLGVGLATYGDYTANAEGFTLTLLGAILAAVKTVATNRLQTGGQSFGALELLYRMSPLAAAESMGCAYLAGEWQALFSRFSTDGHGMSSTTALLLTCNGLIAFGLNLASFTTNKNVGALTMTVASNIKQILTIVLSVFLFHIRLGGLHIFGIFLTIMGGAMYSKQEMLKTSSAQDNDRLEKMEEGHEEEKR